MNLFEQLLCYCLNLSMVSSPLTPELLNLQDVATKLGWKIPYVAIKPVLLSRNAPVIPLTRKQEVT